MYNSILFFAGSQEPLRTRIVTDPTQIIFHNVNHTFDKPFVKAGAVILLTSATKPYGYGFVYTEIQYCGEKGALIERGTPEQTSVAHVTKIKVR